MTTESSKNSAITVSRTHFSGYVGREYIYLNAYYCMLFSSRIRVRIRFIV